MSLGTPPAPTPAQPAAAHAAAAAATAAPASTRVPPPPPPSSLQRPHARRHHHLLRRRSQVYKKLGDSSKAMVNFTRALDLSPKDAQQIKTAILNLEKEDAAGDDDEY